jgi:MFS transporter, DHA3 family, macrolide efflux protein
LLFQGLWLFSGELKPSIEIVGLGIFGYLFAYPFIASYNQAIWRKIVFFSLQGRVFATRLMFEWIALPLGYLVAGFLAERIFEPLLMTNGILAPTIGRIIGTCKSYRGNTYQRKLEAPPPYQQPRVIN